MADGSYVGLARLVAALTADVMFAMSRGSKELFHSDTLAWYLERHPVVSEALMDAWQIPGAELVAGSHRVRREWRNLDLVLEHPGHRPVVIENKVFSLPDKSQLASYAEDKIDQLDRPALILLSLVDPGWPGREWTTPGGATWRFWGYDDLRAALLPCLPALRRTGRFDAEVFERWLDLIEILLQLRVEVGTPAQDEPLRLPEQAAAILKGVRLDATVQKMRYLHTAELIRAELVRHGDDHRMLVQTAMSRGQGIVEMFSSEGGPCFGWQIQEGQFRLVYRTAVGPGHGKLTGQRLIREEEARRHGDYFDFGLACSLLGVVGAERPLVKTGEPMPFNGFAPDFVYRYIPVPELTVGQTVRLGVAHALRAREAHAVALGEQSRN